jgi:hypothetical protein
MICRHCQTRRVNRPLGLCCHCYFTPEIHARYSNDHARAIARGKQEERQTPRTERLPGEPHWRCLWCQRFLCQRPLAICSGCQAEYERRAVGMPEREHEAEPMGRTSRIPANVDGAEPPR